MGTIEQEGAKQLFKRLGEYALLETVSYTLNENKEITDSSSSMQNVKIIVVNKISDEYALEEAGELPSADVIAYFREEEVHAGTYWDGATLKEQFVYYPADKTTTPLSYAKKYRIIKIRVGNISDFTSYNLNFTNKVFTKAYLKLADG